MNKQTWRIEYVGSHFNVEISNNEGEIIKSVQTDTFLKACEIVDLSKTGEETRHLEINLDNF